MATAPPRAATAGAVVSAPCAGNALGPYLGREHYSYSFALERFRPLLDRWGAWAERPRPESQADFALRNFRREGRAGFHLAFAPPHRIYLCRKAVNAGFVFWEFPDVPALDYGHNPRNNWARVVGRLDRLLTACAFTRDAFRRAGIRAPIDVVPVPIPPACFDVPDWRPGQSVRLDAVGYVLPMADDPVLHANPWLDEAPAVRIGPSLQSRMRAFYRASVRPYLPAGVVRGVQHGYRAVLRAMGQPNEVMQIPIPPTASHELGGVTYLSLLNPFDPRKNWQDLISAYLRALGDREDATLVLKLVMPAELTAHGVRGIFGHYRELGLRHRCKLILLPGYFSEGQMRELTRAATYYVSATRAEGANLPLMDALAAGRPGVGPLHTSMVDYFGPDVGWVVASSPEPAPFPFESHNAATTWARIDWQGLHDRFRESYEAARSGQYRALSGRARERMRGYASHEAVWPCFSASLDALAGMVEGAG